MTRRVTAGDLESLRYFWSCKEDLERDVNWGSLLPALREQYPEIVAAWESYKTAKRTLTALFNGVEYPKEESI